MTTSRVGITAVARSLPETEVTTDDLQRRVAGSLPLPAGTFAQATGIERRRVTTATEYASDLALGAARQVLADADVDPFDIDLLLFASASRDMVEPATAHVVRPTRPIATSARTRSSGWRPATSAASTGARWCWG